MGNEKTVEHNKAEVARCFIPHWLLSLDAWIGLADKMRCDIAEMVEEDDWRFEHRFALLRDLQKAGYILSEGEVWEGAIPSGFCVPFCAMTEEEWEDVMGVWRNSILDAALEDRDDETEARDIKQYCFALRWVRYQSVNQ